MLGAISLVLDGGYWNFIQIVKSWKKTVPELALMQIKSYNKKNSLVLAFVIHSTGSFNLTNNSNKKNQLAHFLVALIREWPNVSIREEFFFFDSEFFSQSFNCPQLRGAANILDS